MIEKELFRLYQRQNFLTRFHAKLRYFRGRIWELEEYLPKEGHFLDLGCGHGVLANLLSLLSSKRNVLGIDISSTKISIAHSTIVERKNINFLVGDISDFKSKGQFDAITLIDVLYLIPPERQQELLLYVRNCLKPGGTLLISEVCRARSIRFYRVLLQESLSVKLLKITSGYRFYYRSDEEWRDLLRRLGFDIQVVRRKTSNPTTLYVCRTRID